MRRLLSFVVLCLALLVVTSARAQETDARARFAAGVRLYDARDYAGALVEFRAAYAAKPSPSIKRNVALCLKGLGRYSEAIEALDDMLLDGGDELDPGVRDGARRAMAEMSAMSASVRLRVAMAAPLPRDLAVWIDDREIPPARLARPIWVAPGEHVFRSRAAGYVDAEQRAALAAGQSDVAVELRMVVALGRLAVRTSRGDAWIALDGSVVGTGVWAGDVTPGTHRVDAAAHGFEPLSMDVKVAPNETREVTMDLDLAPPEAPKPRPSAPRRWTVSAGLGVFGESLTFTNALDAVKPGDPGVSKGLGGAALVAHVGRRLGAHVTVGVLGELGAMTGDTYASASDPSRRVRPSILEWVLAPELRVHGAGKLRPFGGLALGLAGMYVQATISDAALGAATATGAPVDSSGGGTSGIALVEGGLQLDVGRAFLEGALFADVHGVGAARDGGAGRFFADSPALRGGARFLFGWGF